jgi:4-amino-4-deoxy-L-arabinose transferase-like glycosyltransferase
MSVPASLTPAIAVPLKPPRTRLASAFMERPLHFFATLCAAQVLLWTLIPTFAFSNLSLDILENIGWGREWQWGYYKHPPLQAWVTGGLYTLVGDTAWPLYVLGPAAIVLTYIPLFLLGRDAAGPRAGLLAVLLFSLVYYANVPTPEFNANVIQMPIWAWAAFALWRSMTRRTIGWWVLLGVVAALAVYAKYSALILFASLILTSLLMAEGRAAYRTAGPYLAILVAAVLVAPQINWLVASHFQPLTFAEGRGGEIRGIMRVLQPLGFLATQAFDHIGAILMLVAGGAWLAWFGRAAEGVSFPSSAPVRRFVASMAIAPYALTVVLSGITGVGLLDMWGAPMPVWISLAAVLFLKPVYEAAKLDRMLAFWAILFVGAPVFVGIVAAFGPALGARPIRVAFPGPPMAQELTDIWRKTTGQPLAIVAGDIWSSGVVVTYSPDRPSVFTGANPRFSPWITPERIARQGVLVTWSEASDDPPASYRYLAPFVATGVVSVPYRFSDRAATLHWAIRAPCPNPRTCPPPADREGGRPSPSSTSG